MYIDNCDCDHYYIPQHYYDPYTTAYTIYGALSLIRSVDEWRQKRKQKRTIKKFLKIVVDFSNLIQDEKNILNDMIKANFPPIEINNQYIFVSRLCVKQQNAIKDLLNEESKCQDEIYKRFFYFRDKPIFEN